MDIDGETNASTLTAQIISLFTPSPSEESVLSKETGLAPRLSAFAQSSLDDILQCAPDYPPTPEEIQNWELERDTWILVQDLYGFRRTIPPSDVLTPSELLKQNPASDPAEVLEAKLTSSPALCQLQIVLDWLHRTAEAPPPLSTSIGYRKFTATRLKARRVQESDGVVRALHPDAQGKLVGEDEAAEREVLKTVWGYVRAGREDEVGDVCRRGKMSWLGALIRGPIPLGESFFSVVFASP